LYVLLLAKMDAEFPRKKMDAEHHSRHAQQPFVDPPSRVACSHWLRHVT